MSFPGKIRRHMVSTHDVKELIIRALALPDVTAEQIEDEAPLFGEGLGLDSVDALELVVAVEKQWGIQIADDQIGRQVFASAQALTDFVNQRLAAAPAAAERRGSG